MFGSAKVIDAALTANVGSNSEHPDHLDGPDVAVVVHELATALPYDLGGLAARAASQGVPSELTAPLASAINDLVAAAGAMKVALDAINASLPPRD